MHMQMKATEIEKQIERWKLVSICIDFDGEGILVLWPENKHLYLEVLILKLIFIRNLTDISE